MPDRAVVDDTVKKPEHWKYVIKGRTLFDLHDMFGRGKIQFVVDPELPEGIEVIKNFPVDRTRPVAESQPRAVVAISEDQQWLVVPASDEIGGWQVLRRRFNGYENEWALWDTGQDAHEVLAAWMEGRGE